MQACNLHLVLVLVLMLMLACRGGGWRQKP